MRRMQRPRQKLPWLQQTTSCTMWTLRPLPAAKRAHSRPKKQKEQLLAEAQRQADAIVAEGKAAAEAERASKLRQADAQIADLTRTMCAKVLERNLTQQDDARMLDDLLQKAGESDGKRV